MPGVDRRRAGRPGDGQYRLGRRARSRRGAGRLQLVKIPDGLDFDRAAGLTVTYGTTLYALRVRAQLKPGETLVVLGASGGTGLAADRDRQDHGRARHRLRLLRREARLRPRPWRRRNGQLRQRGFARRAQKARRRARHRRGLRSGRRALCGAGGALAGLGRPLSRGRLRRRRNPEDAAQSGAAQKLRHPRRRSGAHGSGASRKANAR